MKIDEHNVLIDKAKTRKDGVYTYRGYDFVVKNNNFIGYSDYFGNIYQISYSFHVSLGKVERLNRKDELKRLFLCKS